jgi:hypothetical protein
MSHSRFLPARCGRAEDAELGEVLAGGEGVVRGGADGGAVVRVDQRQEGVQRIRLPAAGGRPNRA